MGKKKDAEEAASIVRDLFPHEQGQGLRSLVLELRNNSDEKSRALGLISTLAPSVAVDTEDPMCWMMAVHNETLKLLFDSKEVILWMSGSADFCAGGQASSAWQAKAIPVLARLKRLVK